MSKIESYRQIDSYYERMSCYRNLAELHVDRWMRVRAWLVENDPDYIWGN